MKEWIVLQGWPLYLMLGMTGLGLLGSILSRIFWKACKRGTVVWNIGLSDAALYKAEVQQLL